MAYDIHSGDGDRRSPIGELVRLRRLRVLVLSDDRRYRSVTAMLLSGRECDVFTASHDERLAELIARERIDVVVIDGDGDHAERSATSASVDGFMPPAGIVAVAARERNGFDGPNDLAKWCPFGQLFRAVEAAERRRGAHLWDEVADASAHLSGD